MNRRDLVLAVLGAAEGNGYSPAQLQKALFLINRNLPALVSEGPDFAFKPYDYGPFDRAVYDEADALKMAGLASVDRAGPSGLRYYSASAGGQEQAKRILANLSKNQNEYVQQVSRWVRSMPFAKLVKSIYAEYPEMRANSIFVG